MMYFFFIITSKGIIFDKLFEMCFEEIKQKDLEVLIVVVFIVAFKCLGSITFYLFYLCY
jgi:hypothetical protein